MPIRLLSYCLANDDGSAPNPYWGFCTLALCKPAVRRSAEVGDWLVGTGAKRTESGDYSGKLVYAMRVSHKMPIADYDAWVQAHCPKKVPIAGDPDRHRQLGDAIYDLTVTPTRQRPGVRGPAEMTRDLSGNSALVATEFWYFGRAALPLPTAIRDLAQQQQGHRSDRNAPLIAPFEAWIGTLGAPGVYGEPQVTRTVPG